MTTPRDEEAARAFLHRWELLHKHCADDVASLAAFRAEARREALEEAARCAFEYGCDPSSNLGTSGLQPCCGRKATSATIWTARYGDHECVASAILALAQEDAR